MIVYNTFSSKQLVESAIAEQCSAMVNYIIVQSARNDLIIMLAYVFNCL